MQGMSKKSEVRAAPALPSHDYPSSYLVPLGPVYVEGGCLG